MEHAFFLLSFGVVLAVLLYLANGSTSHQKDCMCSDCQTKYIAERQAVYEAMKARQDREAFVRTVEDELRKQYGLDSEKPQRYPTVFWQENLVERQLSTRYLKDR